MRGHFDTQCEKTSLESVRSYVEYDHARCWVGSFESRCCWWYRMSWRDYERDREPMGGCKQW